MKTMYKVILFRIALTLGMLPTAAFSAEPQPFTQDHLQCQQYAMSTARNYATQDQQQAVNSNYQQCMATKGYAQQQPQAQAPVTTAQNDAALLRRLDNEHLDFLLYYDVK